MDIEAHRDDATHMTRCAWRRAAYFGVDLSLVWETHETDMSPRLRGLHRGAEFLAKVQRATEPFNVEALLAALAGNDVEYVIVGGVAAAMHGSSYITKDLDICYGRSPQNIENLVQALVPLRPRLRVHGLADDEARHLPFRFDAQTLSAGVNFTLSTDHGPLNLLGEVKGLGDYEAVARVSETHQVDHRALQVVNLEALIKAKQAAGRPKDLLLLPELEALAELRRTEDR